jgi:hypothetical protein
MLSTRWPVQSTCPLAEKYERMIGRPLSSAFAEVGAPVAGAEAQKCVADEQAEC